MLNDILGNRYRVMSQLPVPTTPTVTAGQQTTGTAPATFGKSGMFGDVAVGETGNMRSFGATNFGPGLPAVIGRSTDPGQRMGALVGAGYTPEQATQAVGTAGAARLDNVNAGLRPAESASNIALNAQNAILAGQNARLAGEQAGQVAPLAQSTIGYQKAQVGLVSENTESERQINAYFQRNPETLKAALTGQPKPEPAPPRARRARRGLLGEAPYSPLRLGAQ